MIARLLFLSSRLFTTSWGRKSAGALFQEKNIVSTYYFDLDYHEGIGLAVQAYPQMFRVWLTRLASVFCGNNWMLSHYIAGVDNICPCCCHKDESDSQGVHPTTH